MKPASSNTSIMTKTAGVAAGIMIDKCKPLWLLSVVLLLQQYFYVLFPLY